MTAAELVGWFEPGSPQWHAARADGLGGSEIGAVLGLSRWESPFSLWHRKAGALAPVEDNDEMEAGRRLEGAILRKFRDEHPEFVMAAAGTWRHRERPWQIANPDGLLFPAETGWGDGYPVALVEAKFALFADGWGEPGTDEIPPAYLAQTRWYLDVFGLDTCYVQVFIGGCAEFREYIVEHDQGDALKMREEAAAFLGSIKAGKRPPIDGHTQTYQAVRELHPDIDPESVELPTVLVAEFVEAKAATKAAKTAESAATARVADAMGRTKTAKWGEHVIARRQARAGGVPYLVAGRSLPSPSLFIAEDIAA